MPRTDDELLKYASQFSQEEVKKTEKKDIDSQLLDYAKSVQLRQEPTRISSETQSIADELVGRKLFGVGSPTLQGGMYAAGAGVNSFIGRAVSQLPIVGEHGRQYADFWGNMQVAFQNAAAKHQSNIVQRGLTGALSSSGTVAFTAPLGGIGMVSGSTVSTMNQAKIEAQNEGLRGEQARNYVLRQGTIEGLTNFVLLKVGMGGLNRVVGSKAAIINGIKQGVNQAEKQAAKQGIKGFGKQLARTFGEEELEEVVTNSLQMFNDKYSGIDKSPITLKDLANNVAETTATVAWSVLGMSGPIHLQESIDAGKVATTQEAIVKASEEGRTPTRKEWKDWGLDPKKGNTAKDRRDGANALAEEIKQEIDTQEQSQEEMQQQATQDATEEIANLPQEQQDVPPELVTPEQQLDESLTGITNELVNQVRTNRGEAELTQPDTRKFEESLQAAKNEIAANPMMPVDLVDELVKHPRPISDTESSILNIHYKRAQESLNRAYQERDDAINRNDKNLIERTQRQADVTLEAVRNIEDATKKAGTETARGLAARNILLKEDYSIGNMLNRMSIANGSKLLTPEQNAKVRELNLKIEELQNQLEQQAARTAEENQNAAIDEQVKKARKKRFVKSPEKIIAAKKEVKDAIDNFKRAISGIPPENLLTGESGALNVDVLKASYKLVNAYIGLGTTTFSEFFYGPAKQILGDKADAFKDHLQAAWDQLKNEGQAKQLNISRDDPNSIVRESRKLLTTLAKSGMTDVNMIVDTVHNEFQQVIPDITKTEVRDAMSGAGQFRQLNKSELATTLRDLRGQMRQISRLARIEAGLPEPKTGFERRALSTKEQALINEIKAAKNRLGITQQEKLSAYKKRIEKQINEYQRRIKEGDYSKQPRQELILDIASLKQKFQLEQAKNEYKAMEKAAIKKQWSVPKKIGANIVETFNASRAILTSTDLSALFRQGAFFTYSHPVLAAKAIPEMLKAFVSKEAAFEAAAKLRQRENYGLYLASKLALTATDEGLTQQEEVFLGNWASKIPVVAGSERAYVTLLNRMRADMFDSLTASLAIDGKPSLDEAKVISNFVNVATGRGNMGKFEAAAVPLATVFFAPKYVLSRFQLLAGQPLWSGNKNIRKAFAKEYGRALLGVGTFYAIYMMFNKLMYPDDEQPTIEIDPRSADLLKIKHGDTRIDPLAGLIQAAVFTTRLHSGQTKTGKGEIRSLKQPKFGQASVDTLAWRFIRGKFSPIAANYFDWLAGEDVMGNKVTTASVLKNMTTPLALRDVYDALQDDHISRGVADSLLAIFGMGILKYGKQKK